MGLIKIYDKKLFTKTTFGLARDLKGIPKNSIIRYQCTKYGTTKHNGVKRHKAI